MNSFIMTFQERFDDWVKALVQHLQISALSLLIAILLSVPLAIFINRKKRLTELMLQVTGIFQTIPSLALLGILIPFTGIGTLTAIIALVVYALFPIMQNTVTALNSIDSSLIEAGTAFGMTRWERLKSFILPISMPIIISGIRTSAVMIVGTATLASLIGAGGLGTFIMLGIDRNNSNLIFLGAISSALLAIIFNIILKFLEKKKLTTVIISLVIMVFSLFVSYVPAILQSNTTESKTIIIAGKLGAEPEILINMYKELIESETDIKVELKPSFGKTSFLYEALKSGQIDIYPEFTGTITETILKNSHIASTNPDEVFTIARDGIFEQDKLTLLKPMNYQNTYALAVTKEFARDNNLTKISDLANIQDKLNGGFSLEFNDRSDGYLGLQNLYGLKFKVNTMEASLRYKAIQSGEVNIIDVYSTDSQIKQYDLVVLEDDRHLFPPYQGAPLMKAELLDKYPELETILNKLAGKITSEQMAYMNYQVDIEGKSAASVAHDYLVKERII
ncbi:ABC transporter permease/substrate-binding protein [Gemella sp. GH3]|uniref:ABC transporter permease/substrate-binding protein n=1 Tax=unclassified Gemella TaxID=2624949 RepID=UPI0015D09ED2|nr:MULTISPECIES: ABC transporter permease/substrate-binding protein [unclassified Gemella]MBF0714033.1 ABC transporter permease/substrate-binding protein [Gemella sp. GH3.1]NYS50985.1 ABC transporter permease/substrate-binding protein [Gemella sp. GH3]